MDADAIEITPVAGHDGWLSIKSSPILFRQGSESSTSSTGPVERGIIMAAPTAQTPTKEATDPIVRFSPEAYSQVEELARARGKSVPDVLSEAIGLLRWYDSLLAEGGSIIARPKNGEQTLIRSRKR